MGDTTRRGRFLAEFALIVVGVFVAFSVEGWWSSRQDRQAEAEYLSDLRDELERNADAIAGVERLRVTASAAVHAALAITQDGSLEDSTQAFVLHLAGGGSFETIPRINTAVFEDLQNSGRLQLIQDANLRRSIMDHYGDLDATLTRLRAAQQQVRSGLPALVARYLTPGLVTWERSGGPLAVGPGQAAGLEAFRETARQLAADPDLLPEIRVHFIALQREESRIGRFERLLDEQRSRLDAALLLSR